MEATRRIVFLCGILTAASHASGVQGVVSLNGRVRASLSAEGLIVNVAGSPGQQLPLPPGYSNPVGLGAISWDGRVIVGTAVTGAPDNLQSAIVWRDGQPMVIGDIPGGAHSGDGLALSGNGQVVVGAGRDGQTLQTFRWTEAGGFEPLGLAFGSATMPLAANFDASVIVGLIPNGPAWVWRQQSGYQLLPSPPGRFAMAMDCSEDGRVIVGFHSSGINEQAVVWQDGVMIEVPPIGGLPARRAIAVSADGRRVSGTYGSSSVGANLCFLWDHANGAVSLRSFLLAENLPLSVGDGCTLGMSKDGRWFQGGTAGLPAACAGDVDGGATDGSRDGVVTAEDLFAFAQWMMDGNLLADIDDGSGTGTPDAAVTIEDLIYFLEGFESGC